jgi:carbon storage regulator CsrA
LPSHAPGGLAAVIGIRGPRVLIGIHAPASLQVHRKEVHEAIRRERVAPRPPAVPG